MNVDAIVFDVDGVLWDAQDAYNRCTIYYTDWKCREMGLPASGLTMADINAFKRAGGYNNDWDLSWSFVVLVQAKVAGVLPADKRWQDLAAESAGKGIEWAQTYAGGNSPDYQQLRLEFDAHYWGADRYPDIYASEPVLVFRPGFADGEAPFAKADFALRLADAGVKSAGIITGRNRNELRTALEGLDLEDIVDPEAIFTDEDGRKPDPHLLVKALAKLEPRCAVMVGDTMDDLRTVLAYRQLPAYQQPAPVSAVQIAAADDREFWYDSGADLVLPDVNLLPDMLERL